MQINKETRMWEANMYFVNRGDVRKRAVRDVAVALNKICCNGCEYTNANTWVDVKVEEFVGIPKFEWLKIKGIGKKMYEEIKKYQDLLRDVMGEGLASYEAKMKEDEDDLLLNSPSAKKKRIAVERKRVFGFVVASAIKSLTPRMMDVSDYEELMSRLPAISSSVTKLMYEITENDDFYYANDLSVEQIDKYILDRFGV